MLFSLSLSLSEVRVRAAAGSMGEGAVNRGAARRRRLGMSVSMMYLMKRHIGSQCPHSYAQQQHRAALTHESTSKSAFFSRGSLGMSAGVKLRDRWFLTAVAQ